MIEKKYYDVLEKGHKGKRDDFIFFVGRSLERTSLFVPGSDSRLKDAVYHLGAGLKDIALFTGISERFGQKGAIPAFKLKRNWMVTKESLLEYVNAHKT